MPKSALLMVEFQNEWLDPKGKLHALFQDQNLLEYALKNAKTAVAYADQINMSIIYTAMGFSDNYVELGHTDFGLRGVIPKAMTWQHEGALIHPDFLPKRGDYTIAPKKGGSAFSGTDLDFYLRNQDIKKIYIAGFALHVCILATAWAAHDLGYEVVILEDAVAAFTRAQQDFILSELCHHFGKHQLTSEWIRENQ